MKMQNLEDLMWMDLLNHTFRFNRAADVIYDAARLDATHLWEQLQDEIGTDRIRPMWTMN